MKINKKILIIRVIIAIIVVKIIMDREILYNTMATCWDVVGIPWHCKKEGEKTLCKVQQHTFSINPLDKWISRPLKMGKYWESWLHYYFNRYSNKNKVCLDIGANIGVHTVVLSDYFSQVHAFEPQKDVYNLLKQNVALNECENVMLYNVGLGEKEDKLKMQCYDDSVKTNIGAIGIAQGGDEGCEEVDIKTLDSYNITGVALIKIDVEGHEYQAFLGGMETVKTNRPVILFEEHNYKSSQVFEILETLNYEIRRLSLFNDFIAIPGSAPLE